MVHDFLEMWQGSQTLRATQMECCSQNQQMTAIGYISDTEQIIQASLMNFHYNTVATFKLLENLPVPPALSAKNLPGGRTQVLNICQV
jgi:hypothetical protein